MTKQVINIGAAPNDGTGNSLRTGGDKINSNFTELYNILGWANYSDAATTPATQTFNSTPSKLQIDGAGAGSTSTYLPLAIRGSAELWDVVNDKITPIAIGDTYDIRINFTVTAEIGGPTDIIIQVDIGGGVSPTNVVATKYEVPGKSTPYIVTAKIPVFCLATFVANGGQIFISTDAGSITVSNRSIFIKRDGAYLQV